MLALGRERVELGVIQGMVRTSKKIELSEAHLSSRLEADPPYWDSYHFATSSSANASRQSIPTAQIVSYGRMSR